MITINNNLLADKVLNNLNNNYKNLAVSTKNLSTGLRVNSAADDASGLAVRELMRGDIAALRQGVRNASDAISMIQVADGALSVIDEKLIRMKELAEQAATGTYDSTQRQMINNEFQAMGEEINRIARATDFNGVKLLDYAKEKRIKQIRTGEPDAGVMALGLDDVDLTKLNKKTLALTMKPFTEVLTETIEGFEVSYKRNFIGDRGSGIYNAQGHIPGVDFYYKDKESLAKLAGKTIEIKISNNHVIDIGNGYYLGTKSVSTNNKGAAYDISYNGGADTLSVTKGGTALTATAIKGTGGIKSIKWNDNGETFTFDIYDANVNNITNFTGDINTTYNVPVDDAGGNFNVENYPYKTEFSIDNKLHLRPPDGTPTYYEYCPIKVDIGDGNYAVFSWQGIMNSFDAFNIFPFSTTQTLTITDPNPPAPPVTPPDPPVTPPDTPPVVPDVPANEEIPPSVVKIHFGPGNDKAEDYYYINKHDATLKGLGIDGLKIETQDEAQAALVTLNDAMVSKDKIRAEYGTMQNRLENTIANLSIQAENLQVAESRISDADVALEMTKFVRNQILSQSAIAMLAQANSMPQIAMRLIG